MIICFLTELRKRRGVIEEIAYDKNAIRSMKLQLETPTAPNLKTTESRFKNLYALSNFKKEINPVSAIYETLQKALCKKRKTKFDYWIISFSKENKNEIINALGFDIENLQSYVKNTGSHGDPQYYRLLKNFIEYHHYFKHFLKD